MNRLKGKITIVIGATSGMGESIAKIPQKRKNKKRAGAVPALDSYNLPTISSVFN